MLKRSSFSNAAGRYGSILSGIPGYEIEDVKLSDIYILSEGGGTREDAAIAPPEMVKGYSEPTIFGSMPSYGFYIRHVKGIEMSNVEVAYTKEDLRPAFVLDHVNGADFVSVKAQHAPGVPVFALKDVRDFNAWLSPPVPKTHLQRIMQKNI